MRIDQSRYPILISSKRLRNPDFVIETRAGRGQPRASGLCGIEFLPHRSTAISNWQLLIQTVRGQFLFRAAVFSAAGSKRKPRRALTYVRRIGESGPLTPNVKRSAMSNLPSVALTGRRIRVRKEFYGTDDTSVSGASVDKDDTTPEVKQSTRQAVGAAYRNAFSLPSPFEQVQTR